MTNAETRVAPAEFNSAELTDLLNREMRKRWSAAAERTEQMAGYALLAPGKMLRPMLLLASAEATGGDSTRLIPAALAVEYLHVATLVHDDIIDDDELRRGRATVHARFGMPDALVAGDFLILNMVSALLECEAVPPAGVLDAARVLATAGADVCRGQVREAELVGELSCPVEDYREMVALKTGALFRGACRAGAILGGAAAEDVEVATRYAEHLGLGFQIYDDLLPYLADSPTTGKPSTSDVANLRPTFPVLVGHQAAGDADRTRFAEALSGRMPAADAHRLMRELLTSTGALELSRKLAADEIAQARESIADLPGTAAVELMLAIAELSIDRNR
ncbi:geranylgeranyl diphosphate synthase, type I [Saccharopolyspora antimicrobica]|uniref:Geranylgeranyl diphosphate synthase type I n=1 Tax=Saccharopolyspora antimicrobica TaxID=455193 RepID=A0A1I5KZ19_9PSEU|nr:polyprenyl synthetase family protein [Saccharopolyspora antimicrobica]RKT89076.1 geranylgeranyl diphosphate synthase type I [Saccharopolyspora antimicrobica]SFO90307.1 geranylgeranyl diphosphate synthase, type I [Saccharopolyspora antimicrobica]